MTNKGYAVDKGNARSKKIDDLTEAINSMYKSLDHDVEVSEQEYRKYFRNNPNYSESQKIHGIETELKINGKAVSYATKEDAIRIIKENIESADKISLQSIYTVGIDHHRSVGHIVFISTIEKEEAHIKANIESLKGILPKGVSGIIGDQVIHGEK